MKKFFISFFALLLMMCGGCASSYKARFSPPVHHATSVTLTENDFVTVKPHLVGKASCTYFLGLPATDSRVYSRALADLYGQQRHAMIDTPSQLINWTCDSTSSRILFWKTEKVVFSADLIKFEK